MTDKATRLLVKCHEDYAGDVIGLLNRAQGLPKSDLERIAGDRYRFLVDVPSEYVADAREWLTELPGTTIEEVE